MLIYDARCSYCGAPIRWCTAQDGSKIPLDPRPSRAGQLIILQRGPGREVAVPYDPEKHGHQPLYEAHPATCTQRPEAKS